MSSEWRDFQLKKRKALVLDVIDVAALFPENNTFIIIAHRNLPGEHEDTMYCWCEPEILIAGAVLDQLVEA